jgi:hypothetical protein
MLIQMNTVEMRAVCFLAMHFPLADFARQWLSVLTKRSRILRPLPAPSFIIRRQRSLWARTTPPNGDLPILVFASGLRGREHLLGPRDGALARRAGVTREKKLLKGAARNNLIVEAMTQKAKS